MLSARCGLRTQGATGVLLPCADDVSSPQQPGSSITITAKLRRQEIHQYINVSHMDNELRNMISKPLIEKEDARWGVL